MSANMLKILGCTSDKLPSKEQITNIWNSYDDDKSGSLNKEEFRKFFVDFCDLIGDEVQDSACDEMWTRYDTDNSSTISLQEFLKGMNPNDDDEDSE